MLLSSDDVTNILKNIDIQVWQPWFVYSFLMFFMLTFELNSQISFHLMVYILISYMDSQE